MFSEAVLKQYVEDVTKEAKDEVCKYLLLPADTSDTELFKTIRNLYPVWTSAFLKDMDQGRRNELRHITADESEMDEEEEKEILRAIRADINPAGDTVRITPAGLALLGEDSDDDHTLDQPEHLANPERSGDRLDSDEDEAGPLGPEFPINLQDVGGQPSAKIPAQPGFSGSSQVQRVD